MAGRRLRLLFMDLAGILRGTEILSPKDQEQYRTVFDASSVLGFEEVGSSDLELRLPRSRLKELPWNSGCMASIASVYYPSGERIYLGLLPRKQVITLLITATMLE